MRLSNNYCLIRTDVMESTIQLSKENILQTHPLLIKQVYIFNGSYKSKNPLWLSHSLDPCMYLCCDAQHPLCILSDQFWLHSPVWSVDSGDV